MARFEHLSERSDIRFGENSFDVRDWEVRTGADGERVGRVHDVLLGEGGRTRYLDVDLEGGRHVLMPSGETRVDASDRVVRLPGLDRESIRTLPEYEHDPGHITSDYARSLATAHDRAYREEDYYERSHYGAEWTRREGEAPRKTVARLDRLDDIELAEHDPDPRGWDVVDAADRRIGRVEHLIGDTGAMKVRYLDVELDEEVAGDHRNVLIPPGHVDLDTGSERVVARGLDRSSFARIPAYEGGPIGRGYERDLTRRYDEAYAGEREYEHPRYRARSMDTLPGRAGR